MKVIFAATSEQKRTLENLIDHMYYSIFPHYFSEKEIENFQEFGVLQVSVEQAGRLYTLNTSFKAIASLQVITSILEKPFNTLAKYERLFERNCEVLEECELFFPFTFQSFFERMKEAETLSVYQQPTNELLI